MILLRENMVLNKVWDNVKLRSSSMQEWPIDVCECIGSIKDGP